MSLPPVEIPLGAMRFNSDSQKLEYFNGEIWMQIHTFSPNLDGGTRAVYMSGDPDPGPGAINNIEYITIETAGNATDFGDVTAARRAGKSCGSRTRAVHAGGILEPGSNTDTIDYITMSSTGDAIDFGNLSGSIYSISSHSNQTRGLFMGGNTGSEVNTIDYITIASTGNAVDYGDCATAGSGRAAFGSPTRAFTIGGKGNADAGEFTTIATTGNMTEFGDGTFGTQSYGMGASSSTRGLVGGGYEPSHTDDILSCEMASLGRGTFFGNLTVPGGISSGTSSPVRAVFFSRHSSSQQDVIDYVTISTQGDAVDFGDLVDQIRNGGATSTAHGGLG